eukprot:Selendium_serpulae@DN5360_c0_g1_i4.p1
MIEFHRSASITDLSSISVSLEQQVDAVCATTIKWSQQRKKMSSTGDQELHVIKVGRGPETVVIIHGICVTGSFFGDGFLKHCCEESLSAFTFYAPTLMGFGKSIGVLPEQNYSLEEQVDALQRDLIERYNIRSFHLVGHSYGGLCGIALAARKPDRVKSMTLLSPAYFETDQQAYTLLQEVPIPARWVGIGQISP